jgi:hypothetical protein
VVEVSGVLGYDNVTDSTSPHPDDVAIVLPKLNSSDVEKVNLAKEIALFAYNEERKKSDIIEQRAFGLMQFAKVGLTIIAGIAGLMSNANIHDTPFRESLIILLAVAGAYLGKLFYRGYGVVQVGSGRQPPTASHVKPDQEDVFATQSGENYLDVLKKHVANLVVYFEQTESYNLERANQLTFCYINTVGFLVAFFLFFALSLVHLIEPNIILLLPEHRLVGALLFIIALLADRSRELSGHPWRRRKR